MPPLKCNLGECLKPTTTKMKCRMGSRNEAMLGTHVQCKEMQPLKMGKERKTNGKNPLPKRGNLVKD